MVMSSQTIDETTQAVIRNNIGAVSADDVNEIISGAADTRPIMQVATAAVDNVTVAASGTKSVSITPTAIDGYTPIALVGYVFGKASSSGANQTYCMAYTARLVIDSGLVGIAVRNTGSNAAKIKVTAYVLYMRS